MHVTKLKTTGEVKSSMSGPPGDYDGAQSRSDPGANNSGHSDNSSSKPWFDPQHMSGGWNPNQPVSCSPNVCSVQCVTFPLLCKTIRNILCGYTYRFTVVVELNRMTDVPIY